MGDFMRNGGSSSLGAILGGLIGGPPGAMLGGGLGAAGGNVAFGKDTEMAAGVPENPAMANAMAQRQLLQALMQQMQPQPQALQMESRGPTAPATGMDITGLLQALMQPPRRG